MHIHVYHLSDGKVLDAAHNGTHHSQNSILNHMLKFGILFTIDRIKPIMFKITKIILSQIWKLSYYTAMHLRQL